MDYVLAFMTLWYMWLLGQKKSSGRWVCLAAQVAWLIYTLGINYQPGLALLSLAISATQVYGMWREKNGGKK